MDRIGRRRLLLIGYTAVTFLMIIEMVLQRFYVGTEDKAGNGATVAVLWCYIAAYGFFIDPPQFVIIAEIFPTTLRSKGIALGYSAYFLGAITFTTPYPVAARTIGWKFLLVFIACNLVSIVLIYIFLPETAGLSLEEIGGLFGDKVVARLTEDGHGIIEDEEGDVVVLGDGDKEAVDKVQCIETSKEQTV
jgi:MFS family permease